MEQAAQSLDSDKKHTGDCCNVPDALAATELRRRQSTNWSNVAAVLQGLKQSSKQLGKTELIFKLGRLSRGGRRRPTRRRALQQIDGAAMAHLRSSILYPPPGHPHHLVPPPIVAANRSSSASNPAAPRQRHGSESSTAAAGAPLQQGDRVRYNTPPVFFHQNPEIEQAALLVSP